jgi:hypothetical protein
MEKQAKNETPKPKSKLWKFLGVILTIIGFPFFWPFIWFFKWKKQQDVERKELEQKVLTEESGVKRQGLKVNLFFLRAMNFFGTTGIFWWIPMLVFFRSVWHPLVLFITVKTPLVLVGIIALILLYRFVKSRTTPTGRVVSFLTSVGVIAFIVLCGPVTYEYFSILVNYHTRMKAFKLQELPLTANEKVHAKYTIHSAANRQGSASTRDVTKPHYVRLYDSTWNWTMHPEVSKTKWQQVLFSHVTEVFYTKGDETAPKFDSIHNEVAKVNFMFGEFLYFSSNSHNAATKKLSFWQYFRNEPVDYIIDLQDDDGEWVQVVPIIKWEGLFFPMPTFGGVMINRQGDIPWIERVLFGGGEFIAQDQIKNHSFLKGQSLVPTEVSLYIASTFRVHYNWMAPLPGNHENDIRIPDMPNEFTHFPFQEYFKMSEVVPDSLKDIAYDGVYQYIPLEPYGKDKQSLLFSLFVRGDDAVQLFYYDHVKQGENLIGPSAVPGKVEAAMNNLNSTRAVPTEQRPIVRKIHGKNTLAWQTSIQAVRGDSAEKEITFGQAQIGIVPAADWDKFIYLTGEKTKPKYWQEEMQRELGDTLKKDTPKLVLPTNK